LSAGGGPVFSSCPKSYKEKKEEEIADISVSLERELLQLRTNSIDVKNISCSYICKSPRGLGFPFPTARRLIIALQSQSDMSITYKQTHDLKAHL
jgi:hypothetical protein